MDFNVRNFAAFELFGMEVWLTQSMVNMWIVMAVLIVFAVIVRIKIKYTDSPKGFQNIVEMMVEAFDRFVRTAAGDRLAFLGNWYFMVFSFVLLSNVGGIFFRPPTADWAVTFPLAFVSFLLIQAMAFKYNTKEHLKSLVTPSFIFLPLNIIGEIAKPVSLSFRLFGNILAGMILMGLLYNMAPWFVRIGVPVPLHAYFDLAMGALQAYIFTVLGLSFIGAAAGTSE